ncbi:MAG: TonB-dependent receptor plug domain-containing protein [Kiritimatiellia bacterium]
MSIEGGKLLVSISLCVALAGMAVSEEKTSGNEKAQAVMTNRITRLGEILVLGSRIDRNLLETPTVASESLDIATSSVGEEEIKLHNATSLSEALDLSTGVFTETRGRKEKQLSSFRGQMYPYPDFAINGVWQRSFWEVPAFFPAVAIGKVEVLRSGGAIMVGPNSGLVGAVNVVPRRFEEETTILDLQGGSYGTYRSSLIHGDRLDQGDYTVGASHYSTDGPSGENAAERFTSFFGTGAWDPYERLHLEFTVFGLTGERELRRIKPPGQIALQRRTEEYSPYDSCGAILRALAKHNDRSSTSLDFGYAFRSGDYHRKDPGKPETVNRERDWEYNAGIIHALQLSDANTLRFGVQYNHWECPEGKRFFVGNRMDVHTVSGVIMDEHQWDRLTLDGGLRLTRSYYRDYTESTFNIAGARLAGRAIEDEWGDPTATVTAGAKYRLFEGVSLYSHMAAGMVDAPPGAVALDTGGIDREGRLILDGGVMFDNSTLGTLSLGAFTTLRKDAILLDPTVIPGEVWRAYVNRDVRHYGLEAEGRGKPVFKYFTVFGNCTLMETEKREGGDWAHYREIPNLIAKLGVNTTVNRFDVNVFGKYVSGYENMRFAQDGKYHDLGGFFDLNMTIGYTLGKERSTRLYVSLKNLLDDRYSTVLGFPDYGFQAFAGLQFKM